MSALDKLAVDLERDQVLEVEWGSAGYEVAIRPSDSDDPADRVCAHGETVGEAAQRLVDIMAGRA